jgi:hypothetical protein
MFVLTSCGLFTQPQTKTAGNYQYKTECLGVEGDGTQTVKAWGKGRNRFDAFDQALKNAIFDVIFNGINNGSSECEMRPLVPEVNARQKYEVYFDKFFKDGGEYKKYISMRDEQIEHIINRERKEGVGTVTHSAVVIVKRPQLKAKLIADGILK